MKFILLMLLSFSAWSDVSLEEAYKREKQFLNAQKESLLKMKSSMELALKMRKTKAEKEIAAKEATLSSIAIKNQDLHEEYKALEKITKESSQMSGQLEKNQLKIHENLQDLRAKLGLSYTTSSEADVIKKFEATLDEVFGLIQIISNPNWRKHAFLDENDHLVQGEVFFQGLFSAWGKHGSKIFALAPYNNEFLKVVNAFGDKEIYLFTPNFERTGLMVAKSWKESVADAIPGIVMAFIMIAVLGLFILLARA